MPCEIGLKPTGWINKKKYGGPGMFELWLKTFYRCKTLSDKINANNIKSLESKRNEKIPIIKNTVRAKQ